MWGDADVEQLGDDVTSETKVRAFAIDTLYGPHLYLDADGSLEFAWLQIADDDLDWDDDESGWECGDEALAERADAG